MNTTNSTKGKAMVRIILLSVFRIERNLYFYLTCIVLSAGNVPQKHKPNPQLANWVNKQRMEKKARDENKPNKMYDWKIKRLSEAKFVWAKPKGQTSWELQFKALQEYKETHGDCKCINSHRYVMLRKA